MINENDLSDFAKKRLAICKECLLYKNDPEKGPICNPAKYMSCLLYTSPSPRDS